MRSSLTFYMQFQMFYGPANALKNNPKYKLGTKPAGQRTRFSLQPTGGARRTAQQPAA